MAKFKFPKIKLDGETFKKGAKGAKLFLTRNAPEIAAGVALLAMGGAIYLTAKATKKYEEEKMKAEVEKNKVIIESACETKNDNSDQDDADPNEDGETDRTKFVSLTNKEKAVIIVKCYWPVAVLAGLSGTAMIASVKFSHKQLKAVTVMAAAAETALVSNNKALDAVLSTKDATKVRMAANEDMMEANPAPPEEFIEKSVIIGDTLFYDPLGRRYFYSSIDGIQNALYEMIDEFQDCGTLSLNDYYDHLGIGHVDYGDDITWDADRKGRPKCHLEYGTNIREATRVVIKHSVAPEGRFNW